MRDKDFVRAAEIWGKLSQKVENEIYYIQQNALCTYQSEMPSKLVALTNALQIMSQIPEANDTETLGISGAINKRLWEATNDKSYLDTAIALYSKGWNLFKDYYTGENYAFCMLEKSKIEKENESIYYNVGAKKVFKEVIDIVQKSLENADAEELKWKYATLSNCYLAYGDAVNSGKYEKLFMTQSPVQWEVDTFNKTKQSLIK